MKCQLGLRKNWNTLRRCSEVEGLGKEKRKLW